MKIIALLALFIAAGCILATGCVAQTKKTPANETVTVTSTFIPFTNNSSVLINTTNVTNATNMTNVTNVTPKLKGPLRVSISGYSVALDVTLDNATVGKVQPTVPLDLKVDEGTHYVSVCVGWVCENETVAIRFGKQTTVDFGDRLRKDVQYPNPTAQILEYYKNGDGVSVNVEYINPDTIAHTITAEVSLGYSYIDDRSGQKLGESAKSKASVWVDAGKRETERMDLYFASGNSYSFDVPTITQITIK